MENLSMRPFCAEAYLTAPLAYAPSSCFPVALDSLVMWAKIASMGGRELVAPIWQAQLAGRSPDIPLARVHVGGREVWAGSIGFPVGPIKRFSFGWTKKWTGPRRWARKKGTTGTPWSPNPGSGPFRDRMDYIYCAAVSKVRFYGCGDMAAVEKLLKENVFAIGHKHLRGFGVVREWRVFPIAADHSIWLKTPGGVYPARPLPLSALAEEPTAVGLTMRGSLDPPHWLRETREDLLFPLPCLWEEGLKDGDPEKPELNSCLDLKANRPLAALAGLAASSEVAEIFTDPLS